MYHYTDGGLRNVWLANGYEIKKTPFGEGVAFHNLDGLTESICIALTKKAGVLTGTEFRYIRSAGMLLSQPSMGSSWALMANPLLGGRKLAKCRAGPTNLFGCFTPPRPRVMSRLQKLLNASRQLSVW